MSITNKRRAAIFALILSLSPVLVLLFAEAIGLSYIHFRYGVEGKSYGQYKYDSELGAILTENSYSLSKQFNNFAFQNFADILPQRTPNQLRIITYGGSTTYCYNLGMKSSWPMRLQHHLQQQGLKGSEVLNAGDLQWSLGHAIVRAKREIPSLQPDYIIIYSGINEQSNYSRLKKYDNINLLDELKDGRYGLINNDFASGQSSWFFRSSLVFKAFLRYVKKPANKLIRQFYNVAGGDQQQAEQEAGSEQIRAVTLGEVDEHERDLYRKLLKQYHKRAWDASILENYQMVLKDFIKFVNYNGGQVIYIAQAMYVPRNWNEDIDTIRNESAIIRNSFLSKELALSLGAIVLDAQDIVAEYNGERTSDLFSDDTGIHFSKLGSNLLAKAITSELVKRGLVTPTLEPSKNP